MEGGLEGEMKRSQATLDEEDAEEQTRKVIQEVSCDINFTFLSHYYSPALPWTLNRVFYIHTSVSIQLERKQPGSPERLFMDHVVFD